MGQRLGSLLLAMLLALLGCQGPPRPTPQAVPAPGRPQPKGEPIYFLKGDASLSPGALDKLRTWVAARGTGGRWTLTAPTGTGLPYELLEKRLLALRAELRRLGVALVDTVLGPPDPPGPYDAIWVAKEPS